MIIKKYLTRFFSLPRYYQITIKIAAVIVFLLATFGVWRYFFINPPLENPPKVVEVQIASRENIQQTARFIGTIRPKRATILLAKMAGTLDYMITAGQFVKKGAVLAKLDNEDRANRYALSVQAEAIALAQYDRLNKLSGAGHASKRDAEDKKQIWIEAKKARAMAKIDLDQTQFLAPFDGVIGVFKVREGAQIEPGNQVVSFYDPSSLMVEFDIPASLVESIGDGQSATIMGKSYPLTHVQRMIDEETHMCPAYVDVFCDRCIMGEAIPLDLAIQEKKDVIVIPFEAVFLRKGKSFVYLVKENKAIQTAVVTGIREKELVEITKGVHPGDALIVGGLERLSADMAVKIHLDKAPHK